jgi:predicted nuclease of predicted toxin-antitoxin system
MKIKLDENLPVSMASHLRTLGHDVDTTLDEQLTGRPDTDVWNAAQRELRFLVTQELGLFRYPDLRAR